MLKCHLQSWPRPFSAVTHRRMKSLEALKSICWWISLACRLRLFRFSGGIPPERDSIRRIWDHPAGLPAGLPLLYSPRVCCPGAVRVVFGKGRQTKRSSRLPKDSAGASHAFPALIIIVFVVFMNTTICRLGPTSCLVLWEKVQCEWFSFRDTVFPFIWCTMWNY